jgi:hypothetical protein
MKTQGSLIILSSDSGLGGEIGAGHITQRRAHSRDIEIDNTHEYLTAGSRGSGIRVMFADY